MLLTIILCSTCIILWAKIQQLKKNENQINTRLEHLQSNLADVCAGLTKVDDKTSSIEKRIKQVYERQDRIAMSEQSERPYSQAIKMVQNGASENDLMKTCGMTEGEAQLIVMLHANKQR